MTTLPIILSPGYIPLVKKGDSVKAGQLIAQKISYKEFVINIVKELSVSSDKARKFLCKNPGEKVEIGDVLAIKKGFLGLNEEKIISKVCGQLFAVSDGAGSHGRGRRSDGLDRGTQRA